MIYFIQFEEGGPIKIGTTVHFPARMKQHRKVKAILGVHDGGREVEKDVHRGFRHLRLNRQPGKRRLELFQPEAELLNYIAKHCRTPDLLDQIHETRAKPRPVRVDLKPTLHKALRREAAELDLSMAALARRVIAERYGLTEDGEKIAS